MGLLERLQRGTPARGSARMSRILDVPRKEYSGDLDLTADYLRPGSSLPFRDPSGAIVARLRPIQSQCLAAIADAQGGLFPVGVGHGKAGVAILAGTALNADLAIILSPSKTLNQLRRTLLTWRRVFKTPESMHTLSYSRLSTAAGSALLRRIYEGAARALGRRPRVVVVADECHKLKRGEAARTKRFLRFFEAVPDARFVGLSGTITSKSIKDFAHLLRLALGERACLPQSLTRLETWSSWLDVGGQPHSEDWSHCGLNDLVRWSDPTSALGPMSTNAERRAAARRAFRDRLSSSPGVVMTTGQAVRCPLLLTRLDQPAPPRDIAQVLEDVAEGRDPQGMVLADSAAVARASSQVCRGFYYRWVWPNNQPDEDWLEARSDWGKAVRLELENASREGYDSEFLVASSVLNQGQGHPLWRAWQPWAIQKQKRWEWPDGAQRPRPPVETVWLSDFFIKACVERIQKSRRPTLVWYSSIAIREALRRSGVEIWETGQIPKKPRTVALSTASHAEGLNLQAWSRNIVLEAPSSGLKWEQLLGRTHRPGQKAEEVEVEVYTHAGPAQAAFRAALVNAEYLAAVSGPQKLLLADRTN